MSNQKDEFDLQKVIKDLKENMTLTNKMIMFKKYKNVFHGSDAVNAIKKVGYATNDKDAIAVGHALMVQNAFYHIGKSHHSLVKKKETGEIRKDDILQNDESLYKFTEDGDDREPGVTELPTEHGWVQELLINDKQLPALKLHSDNPIANQQMQPIEEGKQVQSRDQVKKALLDGKEVNSIAGISPIDDANTKLLENIYPLDWDVLPQPKDKFNLIILGAGSSGLAAAELAAYFGAKVAIIEKHLMGGDSYNYGTLPLKALQRSAKIAKQVKNADTFGIEIADYNINFAKVMARVRRLRAETSFREAAVRFQHKLGVDVFLGKGDFVSHNQIKVGDRVLEFEKCIIATGSTDGLPKIPGIKDVPYMTRREIYNLTKTPKRLAVMGGDTGATEMAQALQRLGAKVTLIVSSKELLQEHEDPRTQQLMQRVLEQDGVHVVPNCEIHRITQNGNNETELYYNTGNKEQSIVVDDIFVSVGKFPNVKDIFLKQAGVEFDEYNGIKVDDELKTTNPKIYAIGDCCLHHRQEHAGTTMAKLAVYNALFQGELKISSILIPRTIYTEPEIAHIGLYEVDLKERKVPYEKYFTSLLDNDRAIIDDEEEGFTLVLKAKDSDRILGATIVASNADEMIAELAVATQYNIGCNKLSMIAHPYPTKSHSVGQAADQININKTTTFQRQLTKQYLQMQTRKA